MDQALPAIRQGEPAASGAASITVEKHKNNFMAQYGTFEDKPSQNIVRWLIKAQKYMEAHMIPSLEMAQIVIFCIRGEPAIKVRRMLDVPGENYINSDHFCEQPRQDAVAYAPYRDRIPEVFAVEGVEGVEAIPAVEDENGVIIEAAVPAVQAVEAVAAEIERPARPAIMPVRFQPEVLPDHCLKHYLTQIYQKQVNLSEAERFLNTFKLQKPKQTCSNFLDEFVISYENYAHMKWSPVQLNGVPAIPAVEAQPDAEPPIEAVEAVQEQLGNQDIRNAEMIHLVTDGICKEFKVHCDNRQINLATITFPELEVEVINWQRNTITGKAFTAQCTPATLSKNSNVSALEVTDYFDSSKDKKIPEIMASAALPAPIPYRGQRGGRGYRGARSFRGNTKSKPMTLTTQTKDSSEMGFFNYRQHPDGTLITSQTGHPLCNYCGTASHKRENCGIKKKDREAGLARTIHPARDKPISYKEKARVSEASIADYMSMQQVATALAQVPATPYRHFMPPQPIRPQEVVNTWPPQQVQPVGAEPERNLQSMPVVAAAQQAEIRSCPYPTCQTIFHNQHMAQEHAKLFHNQTENLVSMPGNNL